MDFIIVTGLSGAGKSRAVHALEDIGFYCMDNIPPKLIPAFYDLCMQAKDTLSRVAVVTDIRGGGMFSSLLDTLEELRIAEKTYKILFLDASNTVLINRSVRLQLGWNRRSSWNGRFCARCVSLRTM